MPAGILGGVFAAGASHPFDTVKTRMQAFMFDRPAYATARSTAAAIYAEGGLPAFWRGCTPRMTRIIAATMILNTTRTQAVAYLDSSRGADGRA